MKGSNRRRVRAKRCATGLTRRLALDGLWVRAWVGCGWLVCVWVWRRCSRTRAGWRCGCEGWVSRCACVCAADAAGTREPAGGHGRSASTRPCRDGPGPTCTYCCLLPCNLPRFLALTRARLAVATCLAALMPMACAHCSSSRCSCAHMESRCYLSRRSCAHMESSC